MAEKKTAAKKPAEKKAPQKKKAPEIIKGHVIKGALNVRTAPEKAPGNIARVLEDGAQVEILGTKGEWFRIKDGFVMKEFIRTEEDK